MLSLLENDNYKDWLELAKEVEPLFGPMVNVKEFHEAISNCIANKNAYYIKTEDGKIAGIIALDRINNEILWLAVAQKYRGNNFGDKLIKKAIEEMEINGDIFVQTFSSSIESGKSARRLYEKNGFIDYKDAGKNPAGLETIIMVRKKVSS